jgi:methionyl aminopeptidase
MDDDVRKKYHQAGTIARQALNHGLTHIKEGIPYLKIADEIETYIKKRAEIAFPVNISTNEIAAHYTPTLDDPHVFHQGDVVKIDVGAHVDGYIGDTARTLEVETKCHQNLITSSEKALQAGLEVIRNNVSVQHIGYSIEKSIRGDNFKPVDNLNGHQLEQYKLHAGISIPNIDGKNGGVLTTGDAVAIEPFVTTGQGHVKNATNGNIYQLLPKGRIHSQRVRENYGLIKEHFKNLPFAGRWLAEYISPKRIPLILAILQRRRLLTSYKTLVEVSGYIVAQAEHTVIVTDNGCEITTQ